MNAQPKEPARTDWFPANVSPARPGVYVKLNLSTGRCYFARYDKHPDMPGLPYGVWFMGADDYQDALNAAMPLPFGFPEWPWQGLTEPA